jgi:hypothetical protein
MSQLRLWRFGCCHRANAVQRQMFAAGAIFHRRAQDEGENAAGAPVF